MTRLRLSWQRTVGLVVVTIATAAVIGTVAAATNAPGQGTPPEVAVALEREVAAMVRAGVPADDPKVVAMRRDAAALRRGAQAEPPPEPGIARPESASSPEAAGRALAAPVPAPPEPSAVSPAAGVTAAGVPGDDGAAAAVAPQSTVAVPRGPAWQAGEVECEPIPPTYLTVQELTGNLCLTVPQADGTSRYVAIAPDGRVRVVRFGLNGDIDRLADRRMPARPDQATVFRIDRAGRVGILARSRPVATLDVR